MSHSSSKKSLERQLENSQLKLEKLEARIKELEGGSEKSVNEMDEHGRNNLAYGDDTMENI